VRWCRRGEGVRGVGEGGVGEEGDEFGDEDGDPGVASCPQGFGVLHNAKERGGISLGMSRVEKKWIDGGRRTLWLPSNVQP
jgi:hypothetical protein